MYYKIVNEYHSFNSSIEDLAQFLDYNCEVYEISDGETYLGVITPKLLHYIAIEVADYARCNYDSYQNTEKSSETEERYIWQLKCIELGRKYLDDSSISLDEFKKTFFEIRDQHFCSNYLTSCISGAVRSICSSIEKKEIIMRSLLYASLAARDKDYNLYFVESKRQGEFIIDLLKIGKHLFIG
jgi:hypothetical protein